jgi:hypothetical protein
MSHCRIRNGGIASGWRAAGSAGVSVERSNDCSSSFATADMSEPNNDSPGGEGSPLGIRVAAGSADIDTAIASMDKPLGLR